MGVCLEGHEGSDYKVEWLRKRSRINRTEEREDKIQNPLDSFLRQLPLCPLP